MNMGGSTDKKQLLTEGGWIALGQVFSMIGTLLGIRALTEFAPPQVYGSVTLLLGISALGLGTLYNPVMQAVLRFFSQFSPEQLPAFRSVVMRILFRRTLWGTLGLGLTWPIMHQVWGTPWTMVVWLPPLLLCDGLRTLETVFLNAARNPRMHAALSIAEAWAKPLGAIAALKLLGPYTESILVGYTVATCLVLYSYYQWGAPGAILDRPVGVIDDLEVRSSIEKYARPLLPTSAMGWVSGVGDRYLIGAMLGVEQVGIYSAIYGLLSRPFLMSASIVELTLRPVYYIAVENKERLAYRSLLLRWLGITALIASVGFITIYLTRSLLVELCLAREYWAAIELAPWIAGGYGFLVLSQVFEKVCFAHRRTDMVLLIQFLGGVLSLLMAYIGIKQQGLLGAAMAVPAYFGMQLLIASLVAYITEINAISKNVNLNVKVPH